MLFLVSGDDSANNNSPAEEAGSSLVLYLSDHYIYVQSDIKSETEAWYSQIDNGCKVLSPHIIPSNYRPVKLPAILSNTLHYSTHLITSLAYLLCMTCPPVITGSLYIQLFAFDVIH